MVRLLPIPFVLAGFVCCGASTVSSSFDAGSPRGDGGAAEGSGSICPVKLSGTPAGRPVAGMCAASNLPPPRPDAGPTSCTTDADCGTATPYRWCRGGKCEADQCFTDTDCPSGQACACVNEQASSWAQSNVCVMAQCRVDSDCGAGEVCSSTERDLCASGPFFACRSSADKCRVDADCCASAPVCRYQASVGHWECGAACTISG